LRKVLGAEVEVGRAAVDPIQEPGRNLRNNLAAGSRR
jgi:hypothetical protein